LLADRPRRAHRQVPAGLTAARGHAGGAPGQAPDADRVARGVARARRHHRGPCREAGHEPGAVRGELGAEQPPGHLGDRGPAHRRADDGVRRRARPPFRGAGRGPGGFAGARRPSFHPGLLGPGVPDRGPAIARGMTGGMRLSVGQAARRPIARAPVAALLPAVLLACGLLLGGPPAAAQSLRETVATALQNNPKVLGARTSAQAISHEVSGARSQMNARYGLIIEPAYGYVRESGSNSRGDLGVQAIKPLYDSGRTDN